jgi:hypothetical protein
MNRRQALTMIGAGGLAWTAVATAADLNAALKVSMVIPDLFDTEGKLAIPSTLRIAGYGFRFYVVVENVSNVDQFVWAEDNSSGQGTLSFEVEVAGKPKVVIRRIEQDWSKNVFRAERLPPGGLHVRAIEHDPPSNKASEWERFPFGPKNTRNEVTLRAVFEQKKPNSGEKLSIWAGRIVSESRKVILWNARIGYRDGFNSWPLPITFGAWTNCLKRSGCSLRRGASDRSPRIISTGRNMEWKATREQVDHAEAWIAERNTLGVPLELPAENYPDG